MTCYAIWTVGGPVWGVGRTELEARQTAEEWMENDGARAIEQYIPGYTLMDTVVCTPCSDELRRDVKEYGGDLACEWDHVARRLVLPDEMGGVR